MKKLIILLCLVGSVCVAGPRSISFKWDYETWVKNQDQCKKFMEKVWANSLQPTTNILGGVKIIGKPGETNAVVMDLTCVQLGITTNDIPKLQAEFGKLFPGIKLDIDLLNIDADCQKYDMEQKESESLESLTP